MADGAFSKLPLAGQLGVSLFLAAAIGGGFWYFYWRPAAEERDKKTGERDTLQTEIRKLEAVAAKLAEFQREVDEWARRLETVRQFLPPEKETPALMKQVHALAAQSNLTIKKFTPKTATTAPQGFYQEWPIEMEVDGTYHNLGVFFDKVRRIPRLVNLSDVRIKTQPKQTPSLTITAGFIAKTFVYVETAAAPPRPGAPGQPAR